MLIMLMLAIFAPFLNLLQPPFYIEETHRIAVLISAITISILNIYFEMVALGSFIYMRMGRFEEETNRDSETQIELSVIQRLLSMYEYKPTQRDLRPSQLPEESK